MLFRQNVLITCVISILVLLSVKAQEPAGSVRVEVVDQLGALIINAKVVARDVNGKETKATGGEQGVYLMSGLAPGKYSLLITAPGFGPAQSEDITVSSRRITTLKLTLTVLLDKQEVSVRREGTVGTEPEENASALVLRGADLDALPDNPEDLTAALQALAGPSAGAGGIQFTVDGFSRAALPSKQSIREIRINQNPFSAEYDQLGFGRVEIFTRPGANQFHGQSFFNFNDESLNSRNPFAVTRAPYQSRFYGGGINGPIAKNASFTFDIDRRETEDVSVINAIVLDDQLRITPFRDSVGQPQRRTSLTGRFDFQLNKNNTLTTRYFFATSKIKDAGVGDFSLPSRAFDRKNIDHNLQISETAVLNESVVNVFRFQYVRNSRDFAALNDDPGLFVLDAFSAGGVSLNDAFTKENFWETQDYAVISSGRHAIKIGGRLRHGSITDSSPSDFNGSFTFGGGLAPLLDQNDQLVIDPSTGLPTLVEISSIERYRRTLKFQQLGLTPQQIRALGGGATQFSIAGGNPEVSVGQTDLGLFAQDDWRFRPNLMVSAGLRYEWQTNIQSNFNFGPRVAFAWSPRGSNNRQPRTVVRGGAGIFYERVDQDLTLRERRFNGITQQNFILTNPDFFPVVPPISTLTNAQLPQTIRPLDANARAPYTMQYSIGLERQLPYGIVLSTTYINTRRLHGLRSRNINAPLPGTFILSDPTSGIRPQPDLGNIFVVESSSRLNQHQLVFTVNSRFRNRITLFGTYALSSVKNDAIGPGVFPANSYDLSGEYGRSALDLRHRVTIGGTINAPWGLVFNPLIVGFSDRPFNITIGRDINGDAVFADRPAFATDLSRPSVVVTRFGAFDTAPLPGQQIIPRNFATGPGFFSVNLRLSKVFSFGETGTAPAHAAAPAAGARAGQASGNNGSQSREARFRLNFAIQVQNLFNHTNPATPIGNLASPLFGLSVASNGGLGAGGGGSASSANRRVEAQIRFIF